MTDRRPKTSPPPPRDRSRRARRKPGAAGGAGRHQVLEAAVACILELGFYRASTNEIARRANVSWGSIQYHFGSREALLLAVVEELNHRFTATVNQATITGDSLEQRIESLYRHLSSHYGDPTYLARIQIILNLQHDPDTSADVARALVEQAHNTGDDLRRLMREALGESVDPATANTVFHAIRGMALSRQLGDSMPSGGPSAIDERREFETFVAGLAAAVRREARPWR